MKTAQHKNDIPTPPKPAVFCRMCVNDSVTATDCATINSFFLFRKLLSIHRLLIFVHSPPLRLDTRFRDVLTLIDEEATRMNFWLYIALEVGLLVLIVVAIAFAFREAAASPPDHNSDNEPT